MTPAAEGAYDILVKMIYCFPLAPIEDADQYASAKIIIKNLGDRSILQEKHPAKLGRSLIIYGEILQALVEAYEKLSVRV